MPRRAATWSLDSRSLLGDALRVASEQLQPHVVLLRHAGCAVAVVDVALHQFRQSFEDVQPCDDGTDHRPAFISMRNRSATALPRSRRAVSCCVAAVDMMRTLPRSGRAR